MDVGCGSGAAAIAALAAGAKSVTANDVDEVGSKTKYFQQRPQALIAYTLFPGSLFYNLTVCALLSIINGKELFC